MFARITLACVLMSLVPAAAVAAGDGVVVPVPSTPTTAPAYVGSPARPHPVRGVPRTPHNPHLAANGDSSIHNDGWQSDTYRRSGPLGVDPQTWSASVNGVCGSIAYDSQGRILSTCVGATRALYLVDPETLDVIDSYDLPRPAPQAGVPSNPFQNFSGGAYFYVDDRDRAVIGAADGRFLVIGEDGDSLRLVKEYDLGARLREGEVLNSGLPGTDGLVWFVTKKNGGVGTLDLRTGRSHLVRLGDEIENSLAVGSHDEAYIATDRKLYRFSHTPAGRPVVDWSVEYRNSGEVKPGQVDAGTGTTPTVLPGGHVAITDNADPMNVVVYRTAVHPDGPREVCAVPVFGRGGSATENSLIGAGRSLVVENNYGYTGPDAVAAGGTTTPGFARVDIDADGQGCHPVWTNDEISAPSVVPKLSLGSGLVYAYTQDDDPTDPWYWTAIDFRTGRVVWKVLAGAGPAYNNNYAGLSIARDGTAYLGVLPGLVALRDGA